MFLLAALLERPDAPRAQKKVASGEFLLRHFAFSVADMETAPLTGAEMEKQLSHV